MQCSQWIWMKRIWLVLLICYPFTSKSQTPAPESQPKKIFTLKAAHQTLLETEHGREILKYTVSCALLPDTEITGSNGLETFHFSGGLGLAPDWLTRDLNPYEKNWLSACLLARTNKFRIPVSISIRGVHPALKASMTAEEKMTHTFQEATFYGNMMSSPPQLYVCKGKQQGSSEDFKKRVCSILTGNDGVTECGFILTGDCSGVDPQTQQKVCEKEDERDGFYENCKGPDGKIWQEVVTVFLK